MEITEKFDVFLVKEWDSLALLNLYKAGGEEEYSAILGVSASLR